MTHLDKLKYALNHICGMDDQAFALSEHAWEDKAFQRGEFYNEHKNICKHLGFIVEGTFRSYIIDAADGEEKNLFFYSKNGFIVPYKSFVNQIPCEYHTQAFTDAQIIWIHINELSKLYKASHQWECFGRLVAETAFNVVINRVEGFLLKTPEERYEELLQAHPDIFDCVPLYHIASYLGIKGPSLSRIRKRMASQ